MCEVGYSCSKLYLADYLQELKLDTYIGFISGEGVGGAFVPQGFALPPRIMITELI